MKLKRIGDFKKKSKSESVNEWFDSKPSISHVHPNEQWFENKYPGVVRTNKEDQLFLLMDDIKSLSTSGDRLEVMDNFLSLLKNQKDILKHIIK
jgi:hypothetical protein